MLLKIQLVWVKTTRGVGWGMAAQAGKQSLLPQDPYSLCFACSPRLAFLPFPRLTRLKLVCLCLPVPHPSTHSLCHQHLREYFRIGFHSVKDFLILTYFHLNTFFALKHTGCKTEASEIYLANYHHYLKKLQMTTISGLFLRMDSVASDMQHAYTCYNIGNLRNKGPEEKFHKLKG